jgi:hypothetical protein
MLLHHRRAVAAEYKRGKAVRTQASAIARWLGTVSSTSSSSPNAAKAEPGGDVLWVGRIFRVRRTFTAEDVATFARLSGDANPIHSHSDAAAAAGLGLCGPVVHGMLAASLFSGIIGTRFPARPQRCSPPPHELPCVRLHASHSLLYCTDRCSTRSARHSTGIHT